MRIIPTTAVPIGTVLAQAVRNSSGNILLKKGVVLTETLLKRIEDNGVYTLYINDGYSTEEIEDIIKPELRIKAVQAIKDTFKNIEKSNSLNADITDDFKKKLFFKSMDKYLESLKQVSEFIIQDILACRDLMINLVDIKNIDNYTYEHSLNVAILSIILGVELKLDKHHLYSHIIDAILHDIGKALLPHEIVQKKTALNKEEEELLKSHVEKGYQYLKDFFTIDANARVIAYQHHEHYDGTGYPKGTSENHINKLARIVAITNTYDELTSDTARSRAVPPNEAIEYLMGCAGSKFDFEMINIFVRKINPYPPGSLVNLSNGQIAVVVSTNVNYPMRPKVKYITLGSGQINDMVIDLMVENNLVIKSLQIMDPKALPKTSTSSERNA